MLHAFLFSFQKLYVVCNITLIYIYIYIYKYIWETFLMRLHEDLVSEPNFQIFNSASQVHMFMYASEVVHMCVSSQCERAYVGKMMFIYIRVPMPKGTALLSRISSTSDEKLGPKSVLFSTTPCLQQLRALSASPMIFNHVCTIVYSECYIIILIILLFVY